MSPTLLCGEQYKISEMLSFFFPEIDIKCKNCQTITQQPEEIQIPIIILQFQNDKSHIYRVDEETILRIKEEYNRLGLIKDVEA